MVQGSSDLSFCLQFDGCSKSVDAGIRNLLLEESLLLSKVTSYNLILFPPLKIDLCQEIFAVVADFHFIVTPGGKHSASACKRRHKQCDQLPVRNKKYSMVFYTFWKMQQICTCMQKFGNHARWVAILLRFSEEIWLQ